MKRACIVAVALGCAIGVFAWPAFAGPPVTQSSPNLPPCGPYVTPEQFHSMYSSGGTTVDLSGAHHIPSTQNCGPTGQPGPPPGGVVLEIGLASTVDAMVSVNGGPAMPINAPATFSVRLIGTAPGDYDTEMLQLDISGGGLPPGVMIRESPTLASTGRTTVTGSGPFQVSSFFDVFTELSLDGGQTWSPDTAAPAHVQLVPEPASGALLLLGGLAVLRRRAVR